MTAEEKAIRQGEIAVDPPQAADAGLWFIGRIETPWKRLDDCPKRGDIEAGPPCRIVIDPRWQAALTGIEEREQLQILYWLHRARRDLALQSPSHLGRLTGTFSIRSPNRPNPIASDIVRLLGVEGNVLTVRGLDCLDGTPLVDLKPVHREKR